MGFEEKAKIEKDSYEKATAEYENRRDVKEVAAKAKYDTLKGEVAKAQRAIGKAQAQHDKLVEDMAAAKSDWDEIKKQNREATKPKKRAACKVSTEPKESKDTTLAVPVFTVACGLHQQHPLGA